MDRTNLTPIKDAAKWFPLRNGKPLTTKTMMRRIRSGHRGVKLKAILDGGRWFTCREWIEEFQASVTESSAGLVRSPAEIEREVTAARALLAKRYGPRGKA